MQAFMRAALTAIAALFVATTSSHAVTVSWTGADDFNGKMVNGIPEDTQDLLDHNYMTWSTGFSANELTGIAGDAMFEAAYQGRLTTFTMWALVGTTETSATWEPEWVWTSTSANEQSLANYVSNLVPISLAHPGTLFGLAFTSTPQGTNFDPTFSDFNFITYVTEQTFYEENKAYYDNLGAQYGEDGYTYLQQCGDYERYIQEVTTFSFADVTLGPPGGNGAATPLPPALPLFAGGLGAIGLLVRRRRNTTPRTAAI